MQPAVYHGSSGIGVYPRINIGLLPRLPTHLGKAHHATGGGHPAEHAGLAHQAAAREVFGHRQCRAAGYPAERQKGEGQDGCGGQSPFEGGGEAVGEHHVEPDAQHSITPAAWATDRAARPRTQVANPIGRS